MLQRSNKLLFLFSNLINHVEVVMKEPQPAQAAPSTHLLVFDDRQVITGLPDMMIGGLRRMQNSMVNAETTIYTDSVRQNSILRLVWGK
jgi:hypothetical protein